MSLINIHSTQTVASVRQQQLSMLIIDDNPVMQGPRENALRNAGLAVHSYHLDNLKNCSRVLKNRIFDIILFCLCEDQTQIDNFLDCYQHAGIDAPIILAAEQPDTRYLTRYADKGVRDIFEKTDLEHLVFITKREFSNIQLKRQVKTLEKKFHDSEQRCQSLIEKSDDAIAYIQDGMHMHINPAYRDIFGYVDEDELDCKPLLDLVSIPHREQFKTLLKTLENITDEKSVNVQALNADNETFDVTMTFSPAVYDDEPAIRLTVKNRSTEKVLNEASPANGQDPQTGLFSRYQFMQALDEAFNNSQGKKQPVALLYIMVDAFQELIDQYGLVNCDFLLQEIAKIISRQISHNMTVARYGDHSFCILIRDYRQDEMDTFTQSLMQIVSDHHYQNANIILTPSLSMGISLSTEKQIESAHDMLNHAYKACNQIYMNAGDGILFYDPSMELSVLPDSEISGDEVHLGELLKFALEHDRFRLVYQPIVSIQGNSRENYAVLLRLIDRNNEEIRPGYFLGHANKTGVMGKIDRWVIKSAIEELAKQRMKGSRINFFIQISEAGIQDDTLLLWICDCLRDYSAKGAWITFQFHCADIHKHLASTEKLMLGLKKINCHIAINHFGCLSQPEKLLEKLPIDAVKLPGDLMHGIDHNQNKHEKMTLLNKIAQENHVITIATDVEDANGLSALWSIGVNYIQGFFLQEPSETINYDF